MRTFCILWQWFCPHFSTNRLYKSKESQGCKFGSVKAFNKAVDVRQSKMLITLPSDAVSGEITGTGLDFRIPLAEIFSESTNTRTKRSKVFFTVYCILTIYVKSRLLDYVY